MATTIQRLVYAKDSRGHQSLAYPFQTTHISPSIPVPTPSLPRLHYAKDSRGHTDLSYSPSQTHAGSSSSSQASSRYNIDSYEEERQSLSSYAGASQTGEDSHRGLPQYTGSDGGFRGIYDRSQSGNLVKLARKTSKGVQEARRLH